MKPHIPLFLECTPMTHNCGTLFQRFSTMMQSWINNRKKLNEYIKQKSLMIGDASGKEGQFSDSDKKTAENFGIAYMDVNDFVNTDLEAKQ